MKLTVLGSGTSVPHPSRTSAAFFLETSGGSLLIDCAPTAPSRMAAEGCDWAGLDAVWISHFHADHATGLVPLLFAMKHAKETRDRTHALRIFGGSGLRRFIETMDDAGGYRMLEQHFPVEVIEVEPYIEFYPMNGVAATAIPVPHRTESLAVHLNDTSSTLVYTGDTGFHKPLSAFANSVDLFVLECSFVKDKAVDRHLELAEAMYLVRSSMPKRAMLTHLYPEWDAVDLKQEAARYEPPCEIIEAVDGLRVEF